MLFDQVAAVGQDYALLTTICSQRATVSDVTAQEAGVDELVQRIANRGERDP